VLTVSGSSIIQATKFITGARIRPPAEDVATFSRNKCRAGAFPNRMPATATAEEYQRRAIAVRAAAEKTPVGVERDALLQLASRWDRLAEYKTEQARD
jgi:hypothetical protein